VAFNLVDQQGNHRGVVVSRYIQESTFIKTNKKNVWLAHLTPFGVEDLGIRLYDIRNQLGESWRVPKENGQFDRAKYQYRLDGICRSQDMIGLDEEAQTRMAYIFRRMFYSDKQLRSRLHSGTCILIDPYKAHIQGSEITVDLPEFPLRDLGDSEAPVYFRVQGKPRCITYVHHHEMVKFHLYSVEFQALSGNVLCDVEIPYPVVQVKEGDDLYLRLNHESAEELIELAGLEVEIRNQGIWPF